MAMLVPAGGGDVARAAEREETHCQILQQKLKDLDLTSRYVLQAETLGFNDE
jgi:hypothetical protein